MPHNSHIAEFGTLCPQRAVGTSGKENSMARKRYQNGRVFLKGKKEEKWVGRYREDVVDITGTTRRVRRSVILGTKRELPTKRLAERRLAAILARINCLDYRPGRAATFGEFIERWKTEVLTTQNHPLRERFARTSGATSFQRLANYVWTNLASRTSKDLSLECRRGPRRRLSPERQS